MSQALFPDMSSFCPQDGLVILYVSDQMVTAWTVAAQEQVPGLCHFHSGCLSPAPCCVTGLQVQNVLVKVPVPNGNQQRTQTVGKWITTRQDWQRNTPKVIPAQSPELMQSRC